MRLAGPVRADELASVYREQPHRSVAACVSQSRGLAVAEVAPGLRAGSLSGDRRMAGVTMLGAAVALLVAPALHTPHEFGLSADLLTAASADPHLWYVSHVLALAALALLAPGLLALTRMLSAHGRSLGRWCALLVGAGLLGAGADAAVTLLVWEGASSADHEAAARVVFDELRGSAGVRAPIEGLIALLALGVGLLAAGLYRERLAPRWALLATAAGLVLALGAAASRPLASTGGVLLFLGLGRLGLMLVRQP